MAEKYFWLKLQKDFFKRHDIKIIEDMENGKDYILFYLKLLCESVSHNGNLRFSDTIPYNDKMLATITDTDIDKVRNAIKIFTELQMMEVLEDGTIYLAECQKMLGSECSSAERVRKHRELQKERELLQCNTNVTLGNTQVTKSNIEIDIDIDKEIDKEKDVKKEKTSTTLKSLLSCFRDIRQDMVFDHMTYDIDRLIEKVKESSYLQSFTTLSAVLSKYDEIMQDRYKDFVVKKNNNKKPIAREYKHDSLYDDISSIQI